MDYGRVILQENIVKFPVLAIDYGRVILQENILKFPVLAIGIRYY